MYNKTVINQSETRSFYSSSGSWDFWTSYPPSTVCVCVPNLECLKYLFISWSLFTIWTPNPSKLHRPLDQLDCLDHASQAALKARWCGSWGSCKPNWAVALCNCESLWHSNIQSCEHLETDAVISWSAIWSSFPIISHPSLGILIATHSILQVPSPTMRPRPPHKARLKGWVGSFSILKLVISKESLTIACICIVF